MIFDALFAGAAQPVTAGLADRGTAAFVLVVGSDVADGLVQPHGVVVDADAFELGAQHRDVVDLVEVGSLKLDVAEQRLDPRLVGRGARPSEVLRDRAQRHELPRRPRRHLRPVVGHGEQDGAALVIVMI
jgi:hypothetical protein